MKDARIFTLFLAILFAAGCSGAQAAAPANTTPKKKVEQKKPESKEAPSPKPDDKRDVKPDDKQGEDGEAKPPPSGRFELLLPSPFWRPIPPTDRERVVGGVALKLIHVSAHATFTVSITPLPDGMSVHDVAVNVSEIMAQNPSAIVAEAEASEDGEISSFCFEYEDSGVPKRGKIFVRKVEGMKAVFLIRGTWPVAHHDSVSLEVETMALSLRVVPTDK